MSASWNSLCRNPHLATLSYVRTLPFKRESSSRHHPQPVCVSPWWCRLQPRCTLKPNRIRHNSPCALMPRTASTLDSPGSALQHHIASSIPSSDSTMNLYGIGSSSADDFPEIMKKPCPSRLARPICADLFQCCGQHYRPYLLRKPAERFCDVVHHCVREKLCARASHATS